MTGGSVQLRRYRILRRDGHATEVAAEMAGISFGEARLIDVEDAKHAPGPACFELIEPSTAAPPLSAASDQRPPPGEYASLPTKETAMPKKDVPNSPEPGGEFDPLIELAAGTLRGDVRDSLLGWVRSMPKAWPYMSEKEQRDFADACDRYGWELVKQIASIIAAEERPTIVAKLTEYKEKDGIEAKLKLVGTGDNILALHEAVGREVLLVASGAEDFNGEGGPPDINPDQPIMDLGGEYNDQ